MPLARHALWILLLCLTACSPARFSRYPELSGVVTDAVTGQPIVGAVVVERSRKLSTRTDEQGRYELPGKNFIGLAFIGSEAPRLYADISIAKTGYELAEAHPYNSFGGGRPNVHWDVNVSMLPEGHPLIGYAKSLGAAVASGKGYKTWLALLRDMKKAGFTREDASLMLERYEGTFNSLSYSPQHDADHRRILRDIYQGNNIWAFKEKF